MAHLRGLAYHYFTEEEFDDMNDDVDGFPDQERVEQFEIDSDDEVDVVSRLSDTSAAQARLGKDIQGIPWDRLQFTREKYRESRQRQYKNYVNLDISHEDLEKECEQVRKDGKFYEFRHNTRSAKSTVIHFQVIVPSTRLMSAFLPSGGFCFNFKLLHVSLTELLQQVQILG